MNLRDWQNPWRLMLAVNAAVFAGLFLHKIALPPYVPYIHLLVDYHFGFTKRALIGAAVALFTARVPVWLVFALAGVIWLATLALFAKLFQRTFGFTGKNLPLFVFIAGSPFFLKNFMHTLGHFDIYGCLFAIILLLVPARSLTYVLLAASFSVVLVLIHHIHVLMYVPTITAIVVLRHYLGQRATPANILVGIASLAVIGTLFIAALAIVTSGYLIMFAIVFDYSRWVSNWAVCMFLMLHAVKMLPASRETSSVPSNDTKTTIFGAIITLIPRVGIVRPF